MFAAASTDTTRAPPYAEMLHQGPPPPYAVYKPRRRSQSQPPPTSLLDKAGEDAEPVEEVPKGPPGLKDKLLMSANLVLTTLDDSTRRVFDVTTDRFGAVMGHKCVLTHHPYPAMSV